LQQKLTAAGIGTMIHYPVPPHLSGAYADGGWKRGDFPIAEELAETVLSLPMGPHLSREQAEQSLNRAEVNRAVTLLAEML
jgi:dTDP-4-amino-4,6-dideoxygalactose transaminase